MPTSPDSAAAIARQRCTSGWILSLMESPIVTDTRPPGRGIGRGKPRYSFITWSKPLWSASHIAHTHETDTDAAPDIFPRQEISRTRYPHGYDVWHDFRIHHYSPYAPFEPKEPSWGVHGVLIDLAFWKDVYLRVRFGLPVSDLSTEPPRRDQGSPMPLAFCWLFRPSLAPAEDLQG